MLKKTIYPVIIIASVFLMYNEMGFVAANDTSNMQQTVESAPFEHVYTNQAKPLQVENNSESLPDINQITPLTTKDITPAVIEESGLDTIDNQKQTDVIKKEVKSKVTQDNIDVPKEEKVTEVTNEQLPVLDEIELPAYEKKTATEENNEPVKIEVSSQRIPIGTTLPLKLETAVNSIVSDMGDQFNATLTADVLINDSIILPAGSVVRGTVGKLKRASLLTKEAKVMLIFDHIVTPAGKQLPIYGYITGNKNVNYEGYITGGSSYAKAFKKDVQTSKDIVVNSTNYGVEKGMAYLKGVPVIITAPVCAVGGALGSAGYFVGKSVYNVFKKGNEVLLETGTLLNLTLSSPLDVPLN